MSQAVVELNYNLYWFFLDGIFVIKEDDSPNSQQLIVSNFSSLT